MGAGAVDVMKEVGAAAGTTEGDLKAGSAPCSPEQAAINMNKAATARAFVTDAPRNCLP
jgi:hypothetical protein